VALSRNLDDFDAAVIGCRLDSRCLFCSVANMARLAGTARGCTLGHRSVAGRLDSGRLRATRGIHPKQRAALPPPPARRALTTDDLTYPIFVTLAHEVGEVVARDLWTLRYMDGVSFYELA
jgi:hypothetical protein